MKKDQTIYPKCLFKDTPKAAYLTHDGYVRPCCYAHRHNKIEKDEPWMVELRHNLRSGNSLEKIFSTPEYKDFFERMKNGKDIPRRCIEPEFPYLRQVRLTISPACSTALLVAIMLNRSRVSGV